jgi:16S rRNA (uracil1498-N3)-methyltransferase
MPRFFIPSISSRDGHTVLVGPDVHHIRNVLRLGPGDKITLVTAGGEEHHAVIRKLTRKAVEIEVLEKVSAPDDTGLKIWLAQALPKGNKMDFVIQKATELGVSAIYPFTSSRTVPVPEPSHLERKLARWQRIAMEACKQCGRTCIPKIHEITPLERVIQFPGEGMRKLLLWEKAPIAWEQVFRDDHQVRGFFVIVGPEGGLTEHEVRACQSAGFMPLGLGRRILRTETAALCLLSILQYELGDLR